MSTTDEFSRPRTPLKFGSVPTPLPVDPQEYNIRRRCNSVPEGSVLSFGEVPAQVLSRHSFLNNCEEDYTSPFNPSILSQQSFLEGYEDMSPRPRSKASLSPASLNQRHFCLREGCEFATTGFETAEELRVHKRLLSHDITETLTDEVVEAIPFHFFSGLHMEDEPLSQKSAPPPLSTLPRPIRPRLISRPPTQPSRAKKRKLTPPPRRSHSSPQRILAKVERPGPVTIMPQQLHISATQCECQQCRQSVTTPRASNFGSPVQCLTPRTVPFSPPVPSPPQIVDYQTAWQMSPMFGPAMGGMQALPSEYEWQQFSQAPPPPAFQVVPQSGPFVPSNTAAYGVY